MSLRCAKEIFKINFMYDSVFLRFERLGGFLAIFIIKTKEHWDTLKDTLFLCFNWLNTFQMELAEKKHVSSSVPDPHPYVFGPPETRSVS